MGKHSLGFMDGTLAHPMKFSFPRFVFQFPSSDFWDGLIIKDGDPDESVGSASVRVAGARRERRVGREIPSPSRIVSCRVVGLKGEDEEERRREAERQRETRHVVS